MKKGAVILDDNSLAALVQAGDGEAFGEIVERYDIPLQRYLYHFTGDFEVTRDLVQDTFIKAYHHLMNRDSRVSSVKAWLYAIAVNIARKHYRRKKIIVFIPFLSQRSRTAAAGNSGEVERTMAIDEVLLKLKSDQRTCLVLHFIEGFKYREIAEILGISEEAVRKRVARGSREFRRLYAPEGETR